MIYFVIVRVLLSSKASELRLEEDGPGVEGTVERMMGRMTGGAEETAKEAAAEAMGTKLLG